MFIIVWDVKEPAHLSQRVGHVVPGVVVCLLWCIIQRAMCYKTLCWVNHVLPSQNKEHCIVLYCQLNYQKTEVCVVKLLATIFGDQRIKGFREKGK